MFFCVDAPTLLQTCFIILIFQTTNIQTKSAVLLYEEYYPVVAMDMIVPLGPQEINCYYQYVPPKATFYVSFHVVKGGNGVIGFQLHFPPEHPSSNKYTRVLKSRGEYEDGMSPGGIYKMCIDNKDAMYGQKMVNMYLTVVDYDKWKKHTKELQEMHMNVENFLSSIMRVEKNIYDIMQHQQLSKGRESWDFSLLQKNNSYVLWWSIIQIVIIIGISVLQVFMVRKLFKVR